MFRKETGKEINSLTHSLKHPNDLPMLLRITRLSSAKISDGKSIFSCLNGTLNFSSMITKMFLCWIFRTCEPSKIPTSLIELSDFHQAWIFTYLL